MRAVSFQLAAAGTVSWLADRNTRLRAWASKFVGNGTIGILSNDPSLTTVEATAPPANLAGRTDILLLVGSGASAGALSQSGLDIQIRAGQTYFLVANGAGILTIYVDS